MVANNSDFLQAKFKLRHETLQTCLQSQLRSLRHECDRQLASLAAGQYLDPNVVQNHADIDRHAVELNLINDSLPYFADAAPAPVRTALDQYQHRARVLGVALRHFANVTGQNVPLLSDERRCLYEILSGETTEVISALSEHIKHAGEFRAIVEKSIARLKKKRPLTGQDQYTLSSSLYRICGALEGVVK
jgi:hypothetical protein